MNRKLRIVAVLAALALFAGACGDDDSGGGGEGVTDLGGREVTVAVENAYLPFNYISLETGNAGGWDYDAWAAICDLLNCTPKFEQAAWPAVLQQVADGQYDTAADGISITDERKQTLDFSDAYMTVEQKYIVRKDESRFSTVADLEGNADYTIGTQVGTTNFELAEKRVGADRIKAFDQFGLAIQALITGDVDAVIIDDSAGQGYVGENADQVKMIDESLQSDPLGFIFPQGSDLVAPVNAALRTLRDDGTLQKLGEKYFTDSFTLTYDDIEG